MRSKLSPDLVAFDEKIYQIEQSNEFLRNRVLELQEETFKDKELQRMQKRLDEALEGQKYGFPISKQQHDAIQEWYQKHLIKKHDGPNTNFGAIGGSLEYTFLPTSIGTIGAVKCICGEEFQFQEI